MGICWIENPLNININPGSKRPTFSTPPAAAAETSTAPRTTLPALEKFMDTELLRRYGETQPDYRHVDSVTLGTRCLVRNSVTYLAAVAQVEKEAQRRHTGATQPQQKQGGSTGGPPPPNSLPARSKSPTLTTLRPDCARSTPRGAPPQPKWVPKRGVRPAYLDSPGSIPIPAGTPTQAGDSTPRGALVQPAAGSQATLPVPGRRPGSLAAPLRRSK